MLGQGIPWNIILIFFFIGLIAGINNGKKRVPGGKDPS